VRCGFVVEHQSTELGTKELCSLVNVSRSSYYQWCSALEQRTLSSKAEQELYLKIKKVFIESRETYGVPRVWRQLLRNGVSCSRRQVGWIMRKNKLISVYVRKKKKFVSTTDSTKTKSPADNLLARNFEAKAPNEKWVGDVTFIYTPEGWLYLATVIDLFSRKVVGYALSRNNDAALACSAFKMAIARRRQPKCLVYHSDRGSIYASLEFKSLLTSNEITPSMSRKGNCWDNAVAESFFDTLKVELIYQKDFNLMLSYSSAIIDWIEDFYNTTRIHSSIGYCSPEEFELIHDGK
jgi:transposase InsO family protein